jgi:hypothetical protein
LAVRSSPEKLRAAGKAVLAAAAPQEGTRTSPKKPAAGEPSNRPRHVRRNRSAPSIASSAAGADSNDEDFLATRFEEALSFKERPGRRRERCATEADVPPQSEM